MKKTALLATASLVFMVGDVMAADWTPTVEVTSETDWSAFHIGIGGGYGTVLHEGDVLIDLEARGPDAALINDILGLPLNLLQHNLDDLGDQGGFATIEIGADRQLSEFVVAGIFADYTRGDWSSNANFCILDCGGLELVSLNTKASVDDMWTIGARAGVLVNPNTLIYALAGYTRTNLDVHSDLSVPIIPIPELNPLTAVGTNQDLDGISVGAGIEALLPMVSDNLSVKLEYRYTDMDALDDKGFRDIIDVGGGNTLALGHGFDFDSSIQTIRAVASYRF